ncbi:unnamed protein product [Larinioides sclopetarius]|uniref:Uncharacterized protein n=1 Tax=Larinioides sclopetarius TaxID=280406 RepID=A0AAV2BN15_9ARAC
MFVREGDFFQYKLDCVHRTVKLDSLLESPKSNDRRFNSSNAWCILDSFVHHFAAPLGSTEMGWVSLTNRTKIKKLHWITGECSIFID